MACHQSTRHCGAEQSGEGRGAVCGSAYLSTNWFGFAMNNPFDDFKMVDGVKLFRGECAICGKEFWNKNPYRKNCDDKAGHAELRRHRQEQNAWGHVRSGGRRPSDEWSGSWDNAVSVNEQ